MTIAIFSSRISNRLITITRYDWNGKDLQRTYLPQDTISQKEFQEREDLMRRIISEVQNS